MDTDFPPASDPRTHTIGAHVYASAECRFRFLKAEETVPRANDLFQGKHSRHTALGRTEVSVNVSLSPLVSTDRTETPRTWDLLGFASVSVRGRGPGFPDGQPFQKTCLLPRAAAANWWSVHHWWSLRSKGWQPLTKRTFRPICRQVLLGVSCWTSKS